MPNIIDQEHTPGGTGMEIERHYHSSQVPQNQAVQATPNRATGSGDIEDDTNAIADEKLPVSHMKNIQNVQIKHASQHPISILPKEKYDDFRVKVKQQMRNKNIKDDHASDQPANILELSIPDAAPFTSAPNRGELQGTVVDEQRASTSMQFMTGNASEMGTPNMDAQRDFFEQYDTKQRPP